MFDKFNYVFSKTWPNTGATGYLMVVLLLLSGILAACSTSAAAPEPEPVEETQSTYAGKKVLFVNSYHAGYEWSDASLTAR
jgi:hypothetical protein